MAVINDKETTSFIEKMKSAEKSKEFSKELFDLVMAAVNTNGWYAQEKKARAGE